MIVSRAPWGDAHGASKVRDIDKEQVPGFLTRKTLDAERDTKPISCDGVLQVFWKLLAVSKVPAVLIQSQVPLTLDD